MVGRSRALVAGAGGFIGSHMVKKLKSKGYWVRAVDVKFPEFSPTDADEFCLYDLRDPNQASASVTLKDSKFDEVYQLAADMGGMGFIHSAECEIMRNSALININMVHAAATIGTPRYFLSSSVCVYRDMRVGEPEMTEEGAYPANPDNEYGWEKLYAERAALAYGRKYGIAIRIARFQNTYGPEGTWMGGREKAPAAICRKVAEVEDGGTIEIWGDGSAVRSYTFVDDLTDGIYLLMQSDLDRPANIGCPQYVSVNELVDIVAKTARKRVDVRHVAGPVGVQSRNFSNARMYSIGWQPKILAADGIALTYPWVDEQVRKLRAATRVNGTDAAREWQPAAGGST